MTKPLSWSGHVLSRDRVKRLRDLRGTSLRLMLRFRHAVARQVQHEISAIDRELERRRPTRIAFYWFDVGRSCDRFALARANGTGRRDAHPVTATTRGGAFPPATSDDLVAWFKDNAVTHVVAETEDDTTSPECIAAGRHTVAKFIAWWRLLEDEHADD